MTVAVGALWVVQHHYARLHTWAYLLTYGPQIFYVLPPLILTGFCLLLWQWRWLGYNLLLTLVVVQLFLRPAWPHFPPRYQASQRIRLVQWNVHNEYVHAADIARTLAALKPDIVCLQETLREPLREVVPGAASAHTHDVTTFTRGRITDWREIRLGELPNFRYGLETEVVLPQGRVKVLNVHLMSVQAPVPLGRRRGDPDLYWRSRQGRKLEFAALKHWAATTSGPRLVVGDFNTPPNTPDYRELSAWGRDAFAVGRGFGFTYPRSRPVLRIDHCWLLAGLRPVRTFTVETNRSDHRPVVTDFVPISGEKEAP